MSHRERAPGVSIRRRVVFALFPSCEILDVAGPLQAFHEANSLGASYDLELRGTSPLLATAQALAFAQLPPLGVVAAGDLVIVPGGPALTSPSNASGAAGREGESWRGELVRFVKSAAAAGAQLCSVCTGAFVLGEAGLLDGRACTTHWKRQQELQQRFRGARVCFDRLFVADGPVTTSAGIASGIDMALWLIEGHHGPQLTAEVAREMVVYLRRDAHCGQGSVYLEYRNHLDPGVHRVQDHLVAHPESQETLEALARRGNLSERTLTRRFRAATGISVREFRSRLRLERAHLLLSDPALTHEQVAAKVGFEDPRQLRRVLARSRARGQEETISASSR